MSKIKSSFTIEPKRNLTNIVFNWIKFKVDLYIEPIKKMFESQTLINLDEYVDDVVVIHMSKRKDRYKKLRKESKRIKLTDGNMFDKIKICEAVDGKKLTKLKTKEFNPKYTFKSWYDINPEPKYDDVKNKKDILIMSTKPEVGISLSHMRIWKDIVKNKTSHTLIMEDDFNLNIGFQHNLKTAWKELPNEFDLFYLSFLPSSNGFDFNLYSDNLLKIHGGIWWLSGYILSYEGAKKLVDNFPVVGVVDMWINHIIPKMNVYSTRRNLIDQRLSAGSDNVYSFTHPDHNPIIKKRLNEINN
jgi:GR25 family glycosyltransferase involved in LPS biosynthesis